jgi:hypothetical protein
MHNFSIGIFFSLALGCCSFVASAQIPSPSPSPSCPKIVSVVGDPYSVTGRYGPVTAIAEDFNIYKPDPATTVQNAPITVRTKFKKVTNLPSSIVRTYGKPTAFFTVHGPTPYYIVTTKNLKLVAIQSNVVTDLTPEWGSQLFIDGASVVSFTPFAAERGGWYLTTAATARLSTGLTVFVAGKPTAAPFQIDLLGRVGDPDGPEMASYKPVAVFDGRVGESEFKSFCGIPTNPSLKSGLYAYWEVASRYSNPLGGRGSFRGLALVSSVENNQLCPSFLLKSEGRSVTYNNAYESGTLDTFVSHLVGFTPSTNGKGYFGYFDPSQKKYVVSGEMQLTCQ